jgi:hypothetical protein
MGYFDKSINSSMKQDASERAIYFPWAYLGKGWVLANSGTEAKLRKFMAAYNIIWGVLLIGTIFLTKDPVETKLLLCYIPAMLALFCFGTFRILAGCQVSGETLTFNEYYTAAAKGSNKVALLLGLLGCVAVFGLSVYASMHAKSLSDKAVCVFGMGFFALGAGKMLYLLKLKR